MKKRLVIALIMAIAVFALTACEGEKAYIGKWTINEIQAGDIVMTMDDVQDLGMESGYVKLQKSGKAVVNILGDEYEGTWEMLEDGSGATVTYGEDLVGSLTLEDKTMTMTDEEGSTYKMSRF